MQLRIVNIINHPTAYDFLENKKPTIFWEKKSGKYVGFDPWEWSDVIGEEVLKFNNSFLYEVWQPDFNADKIYEYKCKSGVLRKLFPAYLINWKFPYGKKIILYSQTIIDELKKEPDKSFILNLNSWRDDFTIIILNELKNFKNIKIIVTGHGGPYPALNQIKITRNPLKIPKLIGEHFYIKNIIPRIDEWSDQNNDIINSLSKYSKRKIKKLTMGIDFDLWVPVENRDAKINLRKKFGIKENSIVFFTGSNIIQRKQIDKFINVLNRIEKNNDYDFVFVLAGRGESTYLEYIMEICNNLIERNKFVYTGYLIGESLRDLYWLSDYYVSLATIEGASVAIMKAFATGIPVISSDTGGTYDIMTENNIPLIVKKHNYKSWYNNIMDILDGKKIKTISRELCKEYFDWKNVAEKLTKQYQNMIS